MRIRPSIATLSVAAVSAAALVIVIVTNDPTSAGLVVKIVFWAAAVLCAWGVSATMLLILGASLPQAAWSGLVLAGGLAGMAGVIHNGHHDRRLLGSIVFATLSLTFIVWYRLRGRA